MGIKAGLAPPQVQQRVQLDGGLGGSKRRPLEPAQTQVDGAGVQRAHGVVQVDTKTVARAGLAITTDQHCREARPGQPIARLVNVGQRRAFDRRAKAHHTELLGTRKRACARVARVAVHGAREARPRHELHDLSEHGLASVHAYASGLSTPGRDAIPGSRLSNRHQTKPAYSPRQCLISGAAWLVQPDSGA